MNSSALIRSSHSKSAGSRKIAGVLAPSQSPQKRLNQPREQVAAVCYRIEESRLEFLLVRTRRGGRWIFPKGGVEPGLTRSQSAALEAFEEAGVHGSIEESPFAEYAIRESAAKPSMSHERLSIAAYLCAVQWVTSAHEENRNPTWFSPEKAKKRLSQHCERRFAEELCRVVDRAVVRIERLHSCDLRSRDPLQQSYFDAPFDAPLPQIARYAFESPARSVSLQNIHLPRQPILISGLRASRRVLQLNPAPTSRRGLEFFGRPTRETGARPTRNTKTPRP